MLSEDKNRQLSQVGPGTPRGEVLRRHWHPIAGVDELERNAIKPVRPMGKDLVLFKDTAAVQAEATGVTIQPVQALDL
jgi:5,5'-dehydrodivanillate O-demethylase